MAKRRNNFFNPFNAAINTLLRTQQSINPYPEALNGIFVHYCLLVVTCSHTYIGKLFADVVVDKDDRKVAIIVYEWVGGEVNLTSLEFSGKLYGYNNICSC
jgi:hypothetical protein